MTNFWMRLSSCLLLLAPLALIGCGDDDETVVFEVDENEQLVITPQPPVIPGAAQLINMNVIGDGPADAVDIVPGSIVPPAFLSFDAPTILSIENTAIIAPGGVLVVHLTWDDIGADVAMVLAEMRCQTAFNDTPVHAQFTANSLNGISSGDVMLNFVSDPNNADAGYELVFALVDAQGNQSAIVRSACIVTQLRNEADVDPATADLMVVGGETPPQIGDTQLWFPTGGVISDTVPNSLEGELPARVSGDVSIRVEQPVGSGEIGLTDDTTIIPRLGVIHGQGQDFTYLFCYEGRSVDVDCAGAWATIGSGVVVEEFRQGRLEKRLEITETRVFLGAFDPTQAPDARVLSDPRPVVRPPATCPVDSFLFRLVTEDIVYVR